jgi:hypothetical protein
MAMEGIPAYHVRSTMLMLDVELQGRLRWAVRTDDPISFPLDCLPAWSMLNPALYPKIAELITPPPGEPTEKPTFVSEGVFYFISNRFFLVHDEASCIPEWKPEDDEHWARRLSAFASHLRSESKQASLSPKLKCFGKVNLAVPASLELPQVGDRCTTASWHLRTAIRGEHIVRAGRQSLKIPPPSYDTLLLNAIDSLSQEDYPTAFLLAAISMDHLSRMKATSAFAASVADTSKPNLAIDFPSDAPFEKREEREKVLFELLVNERRSFKDFLHRVPLALTGRSLLQENKELYDAANRVYQTRNRVVHKELTFNDDSPRFSGCDEAIEAIGCAVRLADWFGVTAHYAHPFDGAPLAVCSLAKR